MQKRASMTGADLTGADLTGCNLSGANQELADLTGAKLIRATLTRTILRQANLSGVDLTAATIDEADFAGANLSGAKTDTLDFSKALSLTREQPPARAAEENTRKFATVASQTRELEVLAEFSLRGGKLLLQFHAGTFGANGYQGTTGVAGYQDGNWPFPREHATVEQCLLYLAQKWNGAKLDTKSIQVKSKGCPLDAKALKQLAVSTFREAFES